MASYGRTPSHAAVRREDETETVRRVLQSSLSLEMGLGKAPDGSSDDHNNLGVPK